MGPALNDTLLIEFRPTAPDWTFREQLISTGRLITRAVQSTFSTSFAAVLPLRASLRHRIMCTSLVDNQRCADLMLPVLQALAEHNPVVLGSRHSPIAASFSADSFIDQQHWFRHVPNTWKKDFWKVAPRWSFELSQTCRQLSLPPLMVTRLIELLLIQSRRTLASRTVLQQLSPSVIVCEYDRNSLTAPVILAAKSLGIPTLTLQHGMINLPYGYTPLVADKILVWGKHSQNQLLSYGIAPSHIVSVGHPGLKIEPLPPRNHAACLANLNPDKPVILLATQPGSQSHRHRFVSAFCEAFAPNLTPNMSPNSPENSTSDSSSSNSSTNTYPQPRSTQRTDQPFHFVVRLHPSETLADYHPLMTRFPHVVFMKHSAISNLHALALADVIVCLNTGFAFEALTYRKPIVILKVTEEPLLGAAALVEEAGCILATSIDELRTAVTGLLSDREQARHYIERTAAFMNHCYTAYGQAAARNAASAIIQHLTGNTDEQAN